MKAIFYSLIAFFLLAACDSKQPFEVKVMTFNIRLDIAGDSLNAWQYRKDVAVQMLKEQDADIIGTQEVLNNQFEDLKNSLPDYRTVGVGRIDGKTEGEYSAIFYKDSKYTEVKSGNFWLSETPEVAGSRGWDAAYERIATWAVLKDKGTSRDFFVINTHFDHVGEEARRQSVKLLLARIGEYGKDLPIIVTGDFNAAPDSEVITSIIAYTNPTPLTHTRDIAVAKTDSTWSFHAFGKLPMAERPFLDYIFVSQHIKVKNHDVLGEKINDIYVSDHLPIVADILIE